MAWWLYPRLRVFHLHPANRYEAVRRSVVGGVFYHKPADDLGDLGNNSVA
jgi:hypothetical protein